MQQIAQKYLNELNSLLADHAGNNDTFLSGRLGLSFYYYHLYKATETPSFKHKAESLVEQVLANINSAKPSLVGPTLGSGGAGLGYTLNFMQQEGFLELEVNDELDEMDAYLFSTAGSLIEEDNIDYLHGALGVVHYFAEKAARWPPAMRYLDDLVERICSRAVQEETGCWFRNNLLKVNGRQIINFSLSHGLCGILLVLLRAGKISAHQDLIRKTVKEGIRFILKHKIDVDFSRNEYSFFPFMVGQHVSEISAPNRMAWCYGDLNEVLLLYRAGAFLQDSSLEKLADLIGMQSMMRRDEPSTLVTGAGFCHGAAGLAQFCKVLHSETGQAVYHDGYEFWMERTILLLEEELKKGSYAGKEHDCLEGPLGIAFTLLSYISDTELKWSRSLLL